MMYVVTKNNSYVIKYVPYGTIGYLKTICNEIRQCKCVGAKLVLIEEGCSAYQLQYEWKVSGMKEHVFGDASRLPIGIIYPRVEYAQHGSARISNNYVLKPSAEFHVMHCLKEKYGMSDKCFDLTGYQYNCLHIRTYESKLDNTVRFIETDFEITIDKNGIDCRIPMLEGEVNGKRRYPTEEQVYASMKPLKVYTLDDDDNNNVPMPTRVKVTIEVDITNLGNVKKYATILK